MSERPRSLNRTPSSIIADSLIEGNHYEEEVEYTRRTLGGRSNFPYDFAVSWDTYNYSLPHCFYPRKSPNTANYLEVSGAIDKLIKISGGKKVEIADVGYGAGFALLEAAYNKDWSGRLGLTGIGFTRLAKEVRAGNKDGNNVSVYELLQAANVRLVETSIAELHKITDLPRFKLIMANNVFPYVEYPHWELLKKLYSRLDLGGVLLITGFGAYFDKKGYQIRRDPNVLGGSYLAKEWKQYFRAFEEYGCYIDCHEGYVTNPELVVYRESDQQLPSVIPGLRRPSDRFFRLTTYPTSLTNLHSAKRTLLQRLGF